MLAASLLLAALVQENEVVLSESVVDLGRVYCATPRAFRVSASIIRGEAAARLYVMGPYDEVGRLARGVFLRVPAENVELSEEAREIEFAVAGTRDAEPGSYGAGVFFDCGRGAVLNVGFVLARPRLLVPEAADLGRMFEGDKRTVRIPMRVLSPHLEMLWLTMNELSGPSGRILPAFVALSGRSVDLEEGKDGGVELTVSLPHGAKPGEYRGELAVEGGRLSASVPVRLEARWPELAADPPALDLGDVSPGDELAGRFYLTLDASTAHRVRLSLASPFRKVLRPRARLSDEMVELLPSWAALSPYEPRAVEVRLQVPEGREDGVYAGSVVAAGGHARVELPVRFRVRPPEGLEHFELASNACTVRAAPGRDSTGAIRLFSNRDQETAIRVTVRRRDAPEVVKLGLKGGAGTASGEIGLPPRGEIAVPLFVEVGSEAGKGNYSFAVEFDSPGARAECAVTVRVVDEEEFASFEEAPSSGRKKALVVLCFLLAGAGCVVWMMREPMAKYYVGSAAAHGLVLTVGISAALDTGGASRGETAPVVSISIVRMEEDFGLDWGEMDGLELPLPGERECRAPEPALVRKGARGMPFPGRAEGKLTVTLKPSCEEELSIVSAPPGPQGPPTVGAPDAPSRAERTGARSARIVPASGTRTVRPRCGPGEVVVLRAKSSLPACPGRALSAGLEEEGPLGRAEDGSPLRLARCEGPPILLAPGGPASGPDEVCRTEASLVSGALVAAASTSSGEKGAGGPSGYAASKRAPESVEFGRTPALVRPAAGQIELPTEGLSAVARLPGTPEGTDDAPAARAETLRLPVVRDVDRPPRREGRVRMGMQFLTRARGRSAVGEPARTEEPGAHMGPVPVVGGGQEIMARVAASPGLRSDVLSKEISPGAGEQLFGEGFLIGLVKHEGGWNPSPGGVEALADEFARRYPHIDLSIETRPVDLASKEIFGCAVLVLAGKTRFSFDAQDRANLRRYILSGGAVWIDDCSPEGNRDFDRAVLSEISTVLAGKLLAPLEEDHSLMSSGYDLTRGYGGKPLPAGVSFRQARLEGIEIEGRTVAVYSRNGYLLALGLDPNRPGEVTTCEGLSPRELKEGSARVAVNVLGLLGSEGKGMGSPLETPDPASERRFSGGMLSVWDAMRDTVEWSRPAWSNDAQIEPALMGESRALQVRPLSTDKDSTAVLRKCSLDLSGAKAIVLAVESEASEPIQLALRFRARSGDLFESAPAFVPPGLTRGLRVPLTGPDFRSSMTGFERHDSAFVGASSVVELAVVLYHRSLAAAMRIGPIKIER